MPGIAGFCNSDSHDGEERVLSDMLDAMCHEEWFHTELRRVDAGAAMGRVSLGFTNTSPQPVSVGDVTAVMDGEVHRPADVRLADGWSHASQCEWLVRGYLSGGRDFLSRVEGRFNLAIWDSRDRRLTLVNDKFGLKPLFYAHTTSTLVFGSAIGSVLRHPDVPHSQNRTGLVQFFTFGQLFNEDTFYEAVQCLPAAAVLEFEGWTGEVSLDQYWRPRPRIGSVSRATQLDDVADALETAVDIRSRDTENLGLALSGGLDARTVLALCDEPVPCLSMGMEGSLDRRSAERMAQLSGSPFHSIVLDEKFLEDFPSHLERMVTLTDGHYLSQCIVMPTLPRYRELGIRFLLRGHAGELMHMHKAYNFSLDGTVDGLRTEDQLHGWLMQHLQAYMLENVDQPLFAEWSRDEAAEVAEQSLRTALAATDQWERPIDRISQLFLDQRSRRETASSLIKFNNVVEPRVPYLDAGVVESVLATPPEWRRDETLQAHVIAKHKPAFLKPANSNSGAPVGASRLRRTLSYYRMRVFAKLGVRGYQPYERTGLWLRRELGTHVRSVLLDDRTLERGVFRPDTIRTVVDEHLSGSRNHTYLILALLVFETGQRRFADQRAPMATATVGRPPRSTPSMSQSADGESVEVASGQTAE